MFNPLPVLTSLAFSALATLAVSAQVHAPLTPSTSALVDVVLSTADDAEHMDIVVASGTIISIEPTGADLAPGTKVYQGKGMLVLPGFIDAWTNSGVESTPAVATQDVPVEVRGDIRPAMRSANRKGIKPSFRAADVVDFEADGAGAWRAAGFGVLLAAPEGDLLSGHGALCVTRAGARRELILKHEVFQFGQFSAQGNGFPSTYMGYFSQLRQFFYDSERQATLEQRYENGASDPRPAWDPALVAGAKLLSGRELYVVRAQRAGDIERWIRLADEFNLRIAIAGGRDAWRHGPLLAEKGIPVLLDMNFGEEVDDPEAKEEEEEDDEQSEEDGDEDTAEAEEGADEAADEGEVSWHYTEPMALQIEHRRLWEAKRDNAQRLMDAGVRVFFATGDRKPKELIADIKTAIDAGLDAQKVHAAMTTDAALFLGLSSRLGKVTVGSSANFALWTADPFNTDEDAEDGDIAMMVIDGAIEEFEVKEPGSGPDEGVDASGLWSLDIKSEDAPEGSTIRLEMDDEGRLTGTYKAESPLDGSEISAAVKGSISGSTMTLTSTIDMAGMEVKMKLEAELNGDAFSGSASWSGPWGEESNDITGTREPDRHVHSFTDDMRSNYSCKH